MATMRDLDRLAPAPPDAVKEVSGDGRAHWNGYPAVPIRIPHLRWLRVPELREAVVEAWPTRAPRRLARAWLEANA